MSQKLQIQKIIKDSTLQLTSIHTSIYIFPGSSVSMVCPVNTSTCGQYHNVRWYRNETRVAVYSPTNHWYRVEEVLGEEVEVRADDERVTLQWSVSGVQHEGETDQSQTN